MSERHPRPAPRPAGPDLSTRSGSHSEPRSNGRRRPTRNLPPRAEPRQSRRSPILGAVLLAAALPLALVLPLPCGGGSVAVAAEEAPAAAAPQELFLDRVDVAVINVAVYVSGEDGRPLRGLSRDEFSIRVDGEPVTISNFYEAESASRGTEPAEEIPRPPAASGRGIAAPQSTATGATVQPLFVAVLFDNLQLEAADRARVLADLRPTLAERVAGGDSVLLAATGPGGAEMVTPFTRDAAEVAAGLDRIARMGTFREMDDTRLRSTLAQAQYDLRGGGREDSLGARQGGVSAAAGALRQGRQHGTQTSLTGISQVLQMLGGVPGRKAAIYVSSGLAEQAGVEVEALEAQGELATPTAFTGALRRRYRNLGEMANAQDVTLYAVDARGPGADLHLSAESGDFLGIGSPQGPLVESAQFEISRQFSLQEPLLDMAFATGGQAILNTFNLSHGLAAVERDLDDYYSLGFVSPAGNDGEYHRIEVEVDRPGTHVRHRRGYFDKAPAERVGDRTRSFLAQGWESNPLELRLEFGAPEKRRRHWRLPILLRIPAHRLTLLPEGDHLRGRVQLFVAVRDADGRESGLTRLAWNVEVPRQATPAASGGEWGDDAPEDLGYLLQIDLRGGVSQLQVGLWDEVGGAESYVHQKVQVGKGFVAPPTR